MQIDVDDLRIRTERVQITQQRENIRAEAYLRLWKKRQEREVRQAGAS